MPRFTNYIGRMEKQLKQKNEKIINFGRFLKNKNVFFGGDKK